MTQPALAHQERGQGVPCVLLHAFPLSATMWDAELTRLSRFARIITPDLFGFGHSPRQPEPSIEGMALAVAELLERLDIGEPLVLGGLSMGGYVAFEFLRHFPTRVRALGLFATRAGADTPQQQQARFALIDRIHREGMEAVVVSLLPKLVGATTLSRRPLIVERVRAQVAAASPDGVCDALLAMARRHDATGLLPLVTCPTLILTGAQDTLISAEEAQTMARALPRAATVSIPDAGHLVNVEQPARFADAFEPFLRRILATGG